MSGTIKPHNDPATSREQQSLKMILKDIHAPDMSNEDLVRLYKGTLAEIIDFVAHSVVGRSKATAARAIIQQDRESSRQPRPPSNEDLDPLFTHVQRAESRLKRARIDLDRAQQARDEYMHTVCDLENEERRLSDVLDDKRLTESLLEILERKQNIRIQRLAEISVLLDALNNKTVAHHEVEEGPSSAVPALNLTNRRIRAEHTRDTLAALQAHQLHLSKLSLQAREQGGSHSRTDAERRLLHSVAHVMQRPEEEPEVLSTFERLRSSAQSRARLHTQYQSPLPPGRGGEPAETALRSLSQRVASKELELQQLADRSTALMLASARALQEVTVFADTTVPALRDGLQAESSGAQGQGDVLRLSIVDRARPDRPAARPDSRDVVGTGGGRAFSATLGAVREAVARVQRSESFLERANTLAAPDSARMEAHRTLIDTRAGEEADLAARLKQLLERKANKTDVGRVLVADIERLIAEVGMIAGGHV
ncbi:hypothetical protein C8Q80DRAFT_358833 [Daedaleopsis nitida]|nr:hypothetical protein C8Q80DRAFT_358833 [Daedaleopsis nitida]